MFGDSLILVEEDDHILDDNTDRKRCVFCLSEIRAVPYYESRKDDGSTREVAYLPEVLYFHKECGDAPMEMVHQWHTRHTLHLYKFKFRFDSCSVCEKYGAGFQYRCSSCGDFFLDGKCAVKSFRFTHNFHPQHPLIANFEEQSFHCVVCNDSDAYGISYQCPTCPFRVHQECVSSSRKIQLPYHRHKLQFICSIPENRAAGEPPIYCHICQEEVEYALHCATCKLNFHAYHCRTLDHVSHEHPLLLVEEEGCTPSADSENCFGCGLKISVPYYACIPHYFLHKHCAHLPDEMEHYLHPGHALTLRKATEYDDDDDDEPKSDDDEPQSSLSMCNACHLPWEGFSYSCARATCKFTIDIVCVMKASHSKYNFHQHPLISSLTKVSSACCACNLHGDGPTYKCTTCRFWVHQKCASVPRNLTRNDLHPHMLKLTYSLPPAAKGKHLRCQVCRKDMQPFTWAYQCAAGCKYITHIYDCSDPNRNVEEIDPALAVHLPAANESVSMATLFFMNTAQDENEVHTRKMLFVDPYETCDECSAILAPPCKKCVLCKYFLPKSPAQLRDPSLFEGYYSMLKDSENHEENCHGFGMNFSKDISDMKISISVLPCYVKHESHNHVLSTTFFTEPTWCNSCDEDFNGYGFRCNICDFTIDMYCALLPGSIISHSYDKVHGFKLAYYSFEGVEEYICEICEGDITTSWFYHCVECDLSLHPRCIWKIHVKFGSLSNYYEDYNDKYYLFAVPTDKAPAIKCNLCYEVTTPCRYSLFNEKPGSLREKVHLSCLQETERWPEERSELRRRVVATVRSKQDHYDKSWF